MNGRTLVILLKLTLNREGRKKENILRQFIVVIFIIIVHITVIITERQTFKDAIPLSALRVN